MKLRNLFGEIKKSAIIDVEKYIDSHYEELINQTPEPIAEGKFSLAMDIDVQEAISENTKYCFEDQDSENFALTVKEEENAEIRYSRKVSFDSGVRCSLKIPSGLQLILENVDESFAESLIRTIDYVGMKDSEVYNKADISRQLFNNIKNNPNYHPSKQTVLSLICAMKLKYSDSVELLKRAGYAFSKSSKFDLIVEYCIRNSIYKIADINDILYHFDQPLLGSSKM